MSKIDKEKDEELFEVTEEPLEIQDEVVEAEEGEEEEVEPVKKEIVIRPIPTDGENTLEKAYFKQTLNCDLCALRPFSEEDIARCEHYASGNPCYYTPIKIDTPDGMIANTYKMVEIAFNRFFKAALVEKQDGGVLDKAVSDEMRRLIEMLEGFKRLTTKENKISIQAQGEQGTSVLGELLKDIMKN